MFGNKVKISSKRGFEACQYAGCVRVYVFVASKHLAKRVETVHPSASHLAPTKCIGHTSNLCIYIQDKKSKLKTMGFNGDAAGTS